MRPGGDSPAPCCTSQPPKKEWGGLVSPGLPSMSHWAHSGTAWSSGHAVWLQPKDALPKPGMEQWLDLSLQVGTAQGGGAGAGGWHVVLSWTGAGQFCISLKEAGLSWWGFGSPVSHGMSACLPSLS